MFKDEQKEWISNFLYYLGRKYKAVFMDLLEANLLSDKDKTILIERYINNKSIKEISDIVYLAPRQVHHRRQNALSIIASHRFN